MKTYKLLIYKNNTMYIHECKNHTIQMSIVVEASATFLEIRSLYLFKRSKDMAGQEKVIIIGAGLVGSLLAIYFARRGYDVDVYEKRSMLDERVAPTEKPTANITISQRGFRALDKLGLGDTIRRVAVPLFGRTLHLLDNRELIVLPYGNRREALYSLPRQHLNTLLFSMASQQSEIRFSFDEKCVDIDAFTPAVMLQNTKTGVLTKKSASVIFGADGAFSTVRSQLQNKHYLCSSQQFMRDGYKSLTVPSTVDEGWTKEKNTLHVWPRGHYMLLGFPNHDKSFTLFLQLPFQGTPSFESIRNTHDLHQFLTAAFPDVLPYIPTYAEEYFRTPPNTMVTVDTAPWVIHGRIALIGDAAHAIVPHYGQGANAGFEDCLILDECIQTHGTSWPKILALYERLRKPNTDAMATLALEHAVTLREKIKKSHFRVQNEIERKIDRMYPERSVSLHSLLSFTNETYLDAIGIYNKNKYIIDSIMEKENIEEEWASGEVEMLIHRLVHKVDLLRL
jgi:kynurenine 3-monooxygenase